MPHTRIGTASGLFKTFGSIGSVASSAIIALTFRTGARDAELHTLAMTMIAVSVAGLVLVLADRRVMCERS